MLDAVVGKVKRRLDIEGMEDPALERNQVQVNKILSQDLARNVHSKVKRLIR
jgi:hypothetical protein